MKKLYFLNEEESNRILNLHKDATKRQYLSENIKKLITEGTGTKEDPLTDADLEPAYDDFFDGLVALLDGYVTEDVMKRVSNIITKYSTLFAINDDNPNAITVEPALKRLSTLYSIDEDGDSLLDDINSVGTKTFSLEAIKEKNRTIALLKKALTETPTDTEDKEVPTDKKDPIADALTYGSRELWKKYPCVVNHPKVKEYKYNNGNIYYDLNDITYQYNGTKTKWTKDSNNEWIEGETVPFTCNDAEFKTKTTQSVVPCPVGKGTTPEIKSFQDWLDDNSKGWLPKYPDGLNSEVNKGYGLCGPSTRRAWANVTLKNAYVNGVSPQPETMNKKEVTTVQEPNAELELKQTTSNTGATVASAKSPEGAAEATSEYL